MKKPFKCNEPTMQMDGITMHMDANANAMNLSWMPWTHLANATA